MQSVAIEEIAALPHDEASRQEDFAAFAARHSRFAFQVAYALLRNTYDAEDVVQETFLKLYRNHGWRDLRDERAFLARCTWRLAKTHLGAARPAEALRDEHPTTGTGPEQQAVAANTAANIHHMIDRLPEDLRQPLVLSATQDLNSRQIARILGIPEGTVRTRIQRARQMLKKKMAHNEAHRQEIHHGR